MPTALAAAVKLNAPRPRHSSSVPCPMRRTLAEEVVRSMLLAPAGATCMCAWYHGLHVILFSSRLTSSLLHHPGTPYHSTNCLILKDTWICYMLCTFL